MRTFIALVPPPAVTGRLERLGAEIRRIDPSLRCEHADKLHFTLEFLGEKSEAWMDECRRALSAALSATAPFTASILRIGFFPGRERPRIIWAGSQPDENRALCALASSVRRACVQLGHVPEPKPFHPHITLTRVKSPLAPAAVGRIASIVMEPLAFECREIAAIKSTLGPGGSKYEMLYSIPLIAKEI